MMQDPRFAIEAELARMNEPTDGERFAQERPKLRRFVGRTGGKKQEKKRTEFDQEPLSTVSILHRDGRLFERRITEIGGKTVTVELGNKQLHGADLIVRPGSVVHGSLPSDEERVNLDKTRIEKRSNILFLDKDGNPLSVVANQFPPHSFAMSTRSFTSSQADEDIFAQSHILDSSWEPEIHTNDVDECFSAQAEVALSGLVPTERPTALTAFECLRACARHKRCRSVNFSSSASICEIFTASDGPTAKLQSRLGFTFYVKKRTDTLRCIDNVFRLTNLDPGIISNPRISKSRNLNGIESRIRPYSHRLLSSKAECSKGSGVLFVRSSGARNEKATHLDTVSNISEDDCIFSCLTNKAADEHPVRCASVEYESKTQRCTLSPDARADALTSHQLTTFYEKICLAQSVSNQCSGAILDRMANMVMVGFMRDTAMTSGADECIERCVMAEKSQGFKCLSIMYYYDETAPNCILNDASSRTNPKSFVMELSSIVDYFDLDDCYGLPETVNTRQKFYATALFPDKEVILSGRQDLRSHHE